MSTREEDPRVTPGGVWLCPRRPDGLPRLPNAPRGEVSPVGLRSTLGGEGGADELVKPDDLLATGWSLSRDVTLLPQATPAVPDERGAC